MRIPLLLAAIGLHTALVMAEELHHPRIQLQLSYPKELWRGGIQTNRDPDAPDLILMKEGKTKALSVTTVTLPTQAAPFDSAELKEMNEFARSLDYRHLTRQFTNFMGTRAYQITIENTRLRSKGLVYFLYHDTMRYTVSAISYGTVPESDAELLSILKSMRFTK